MRKMGRKKQGGRGWKEEERKGKRGDGKGGRRERLCDSRKIGKRKGEMKTRRKINNMREK